MKHIAFVITACCCMSLFIVFTSASAYAQTIIPKVEIKDTEKSLDSQWQGKHVAFLGDSMTDPNTITTSAWYWQYLKELLGIEYHVYARSGFQWNGIYRKAMEMQTDRGDSIDAILIWAGTNDYNHDIPLGEFYTETDKETNFNGQTVTRKHRELVLNDATFCGRINKVMAFLKQNYPTKQVIILTPIHRAFATFSQTNVQPEETYANGLGLYIESYIDALKQAGSNWSVPVIDLYSISGLYPLEPADSVYFHDNKTDLLHPGTLGHYRLAKTLQYQLLALPANFE